MNDYIRIKGARANNLKNVDIEIPRNKLVVMTGVSGSGKSSLAFDTIYAEGQRRYVESLSSYARQFLGQMDKPDLDYIQGLSPAISIDQKTGSRNPRSTVGTVTEIYDYMRLLWARIGKPHCPKCGKEIRQQTIDQIIDQLMLLPEGTKLMILAPVVRARKGEYVKVFEDARRSGYVRVRVDGSMYELSEEIKLDKNKKHTIEVVVDRVVIKDGIMRRLADSVETAASLANGLVIADVVSENRQILFSQNYACPDCGISIEELTPRMFSFNTPYGACPKCDGLGMQLLVDPDLIIPDDSLSINGGAIKATGWGSGSDSIAAMYYNALAKKYGFTLDTPIAEMPDGVKDILLYGSKGEKLDLSYERERKNSSFAGKFSRPFEGICKNLERRYFETQSPAMRAEIEECMSEVTCPECHGQRLRKEALAVTVGGINIARMGDMSVIEAIEFVESLELSEKEHIIADRIIKEIKARLGFLKNVGLQYLSLSRGAATLSGGESQRIRLATQIGAALTGVLYILDEPSIGLHQRDNEKLLKTLEDLRDLGNTLIVVEHDEDTMRAADYIVDIGPGAGMHGGNVVAAGTVEDICACPDSLTGQYLSGKRKIPVPSERRKTDKGFIHISGAAEHNLKNIDIDIPKGVITCVTGVSGSGKSSLVNEILYKTLALKKNRAKVKPGKCAGISGIDDIDKVIDIDQSPIGRTPRSNPATYTGLFNDIRELFASTEDARLRGYNSGRFSFNVKGGRCEACKGDGVQKIEMHFLPDVYVPCDVCKGKRYNRETLEVCYKGKNINDVLNMTVEEACTFFENLPKLKTKLDTLYEVGLGYVTLGQSSTTLSGGEAQRVKLATELSRRSTGSTVYILDEPTTGLHMADVHKLISIIDRLADAGNTVVIIEHNLDVIKTADYIIDLGPEGGDGGGTLVFAGTPEECAACEDSYTGQFLKKML